MDVLLIICAIFALVGLHAFFIAAEFALLGARTRTTPLEIRAKDGDRKAQLALAAIEQLEKYLAGTQLGATITSLALGWMSAVTLLPLVLSREHTAVALWSVYGLSTVVIFASLVCLHVVLGKIVPKTIAVLSPEQLSCWLAPPLVLFTWLFLPLIRLFQSSANGFLRLFAIRPPSYTEHIHDPEGLLRLLSESREHGLVEESDADMIAGVLDLSSTSVRQAMTPRTEIHAVERQWPLEKIIETVRRSGVSRLPVYDEDLDHIVGILLAKDLLNFFEDPSVFHTDLVMREPLFTPATTPVDDLMQELRQRSAHLAIVIDEFGGTLGLITLEDLLEEIVGEIFDEFDQASATEIVQATADGRLYIPGDLPIQELNERYQLHLSAGDYVTVAGLVLAALGHVPTVGQAVEVDGITFRVVAMDRQRIERLEVALPLTDDRHESTASDTTEGRAERGV
jgi:CBS domain containing-hemolysin-like protein